MKKSFFKNKQIEIFTVRGDPTLAYEWACVLAQEMFAERGLAVFKTSSGRGNFMKGYAGEECIFLLGYIDQDMDLYELTAFFEGEPGERLGHIDMSNVKTIIMTTFQSPETWEYEANYIIIEEIGYMLRLIDHKIEVTKMPDGFATIKEVRLEGGAYPSKTIIRENVNIESIAESQLRNSCCGYFEPIDVLDLVVGPEFEMYHLQQRIDRLTISQRKQVSAMIDAHYVYVSAKQVEEFISEMDEYFYLPYVLSDRDNGYDILNHQGKKEIPEFISLFFDFEAYGKAVILPEYGSVQMRHITRFGYISRIDPWEGADREYVEKFKRIAQESEEAGGQKHEGNGMSEVSTDMPRILEDDFGQLYLDLPC